MTPPDPILSIIIAAPPGQKHLKSVESILSCIAPSDRVEVCIARGRMPSVQRNRAAEAARGKWLYFLDDDSVLPPGSWRRVLDWLERSDADVVGGPNVCPDDASFLQRLFEVLLGSFLTFGPSRSRYLPVGPVRISSEKELILCNLMVRRDPFLSAGGFDEALYPNEENALMETVQERGGRLWYDPELIVLRYPRATLPSFLYMLFRYGRGRAQQFRRKPSAGSLLNMVPAFFVVYLAVLFLILLQFTAFIEGLPVWLLDPLAHLLLTGSYVAALLGQCLVNLPRFGLVRSVLSLPMMVASHLSYGTGFWFGCAGRFQTERSACDPSEVELERLESHEGTPFHTNA